MGNPRKDRPVRRKNQPSKVQISAGANGGKQDVLQSENGLSIALEQVDPQVLVFARVGAVVTLHRVDEIYEARLDKQRLGNVPLNFTAIISARQITFAVIEQFRQVPSPQVTVRVSLWHNN
jgi:hypothetical protein